MAWQPEDLTPQIDGVTDTFSTTFIRRTGQVVLHYNGDQLEANQFEEPTAKEIKTLFVPQVGDTLHVAYLTDETVEGRVLGFPDDPTAGPPPTIPQGLFDLLDELDNRIDGNESNVADLQDQIGKRFDYKESCEAATLSDLGAVYDSTGGGSARGRLTGTPNAIDGVPLVAGFRVLVKDQTNLDENGIWEVLVVGTGADGEWERAADFDQDAEVTSGARTTVIAGAVNARTAWALVSQDPIVVGGTLGDSLVFAPSGQGATLSPNDKGFSVTAPTSGDGAATGLAISAVPRGAVMAFVNGNKQQVGDGIKTLDCYFSGDGGTTARTFGTIQTGDQLYWNGTIALFDLSPTDVVDLEYVE